MRALVLEKIGQPLQLRELSKPKPEQDEVLIKVSACALCRTDLHIIDGELSPPHLPLILGHQVVGRVEALGPGKTNLKVGDRVGVPWLGKTCGHCEYCAEKRENLCEKAEFTGFHRQGGLAEYCVADSHFVFPLPERYSDVEVAPLLCAGMVGYRSYKMIGNAKRIGFYGFGASAHLLIQIATYQKRSVFAFTRKGDTKNQASALALGAKWAGDSETAPPELLDAAILFAPAGELVPTALRAVKKGGVVVCAEIHMSDIPSFPYEILWGERVLRSVANLTRQDGEELLALAPKIPIKTQYALYKLEEAENAIKDLREGRVEGSAVIQI